MRVKFAFFFQRIVFLLTSLAMTWSANAHTASFSNLDRISIPIAGDDDDTGPGEPYPSTIEVRNYPEGVGKITVTLTNLQHSFVPDLDILLVGPGGQSVLLMSDVGDAGTTGALTLTFDDAAAASLRASGAITSGSYKPTRIDDGGAETFPPPAPSGNYGSALSVFSGTDPNGTWRLFVVDDGRGDRGSIGGWILNIEGNTTFLPTISDIADQTAVQGSPSASIPFVISDVETPARDLRLTGQSSNPQIVPDANILFGGSDSNRNVTIIPAASQFGLTTITISVSDGTNAVSKSFLLTVNPRNEPTTNSTAITIIDNKPASVYPSEITLSGQRLELGKVRVTLYGLSHAFLSDVDILLVGPTGRGVVLMSDAGGQNSASNLTLEFDDSADAPVSDADAPVSGFYKPTNYDGGDNPEFPAPAPVGPYGTSLSAFNGTNPNGTWSLYVKDDGAGASGSILRGWSITLAALGNSEPVITTIPHQVGTQDTPSQAIPFSIGDAETPPDNLRLSATSSNPGLLPTNNIAFGGAGANRTVILTPAGSQSGFTTVTISVNDGTNSVSSSFDFNVRPVGVTFFTTNQITIRDRTNADPYAATLDITNLGTKISKVTLTLSNLTHSAPGDIDMILASPDGKAAAVMSDAGGAGGTTPLRNFTFTLDDSASSALPATSALTNAFYRPAAYEDNDFYAAPAPPPTGSALSLFKSIVPNGAWSLYIMDDAAGDAGSIAGWGLTFFTPSMSTLANQTIDEDGETEIAFTVGEPESDPNTLQITVSSSNTNLINGSGMTVGGSGGNRTLRLKPAANASGEATITVTATGTTGGQISRNFLLTVQAVNDAPQITAVPDQSVNEHSNLSLTLAATDVDNAANQITFSLAPGAPAGMTLSAAGAFSWTPTEAQGPQVLDVVVRATDNGTPAATGTATIRIIVREVNTPPTLTVPANQIIDEAAVLNVSASATDPDLPANPLTFILLAGPAGATIESNSGLINWTTTEANGPSTNVFTVKVTDSVNPLGNATNSFTVVVNEVNAAPTLTLPATQTVDELAAFTLSSGPADRDLPTNALTFALVSAPAGMTVSAAGVVSWTPTEAQGPATNTVTLRVTDNGTPSLSATQSISVIVREVNTAPVLGTVENRTIDELTAVSFRITATDADTPTNTLSFALTAPIPAGVNFNTGTGEFSWTPTEAQGPSTNSFTVTVTDNGSPAMNASQTFTITVREVNTAPVLTVPGNTNINELAAATFTVSATDSDVPGTLSYSLVAAPAGAAINAASGAITWTPTEAQGPSTNTFTVRVSDNGTPVLSDTKSFTVIVTEVNAAPVLAPLTNLVAHAGMVVSVTAQAADSDVPANSLTYSLTSSPAGAAINGSSGLFTWTPTDAQAGTTNTVTVRASDNGTPAQSDSKTFTITVLPRPTLQIAKGANGVSLAWESIAGQSYAVEHKREVEAAAWSTLTIGATNRITATGRATVVIDGSAATEPRRFYRLRLLDR